ncbi:MULTISPECIES: hypothetical protein [Marinobacter]|uniref:hypothetical protein n=1 Tax=Marinobacter TaxID=2742 RepID=UPI00281182B4|nr:hypothetical protein [Marinobacter sp. F26243]
MPDDKSDTVKNTDVADRRDRKFSVSTNRGQSSHRVRYVEAGGAGVDIDECTFCEAMPDLSGPAQKSEDQTDK